MVNPRMRPRFEIRVPMTADQAIERLREELSRSDCPHEGHVYPKHIEIRVDRSARTFWSPELILSTEEVSGEAIIKGRFGPRQNLWTLFVAMYATLAFGTLVGLVLGFSQATLSQTAWGLWLVPICLALVGVVYGAAMVGRTLGSAQMAELRSLVEQAVGVEQSSAFVPSPNSLIVGARS